jgi:hypothetical protein
MTDELKKAVEFAADLIAKDKAKALETPKEDKPITPPAVVQPLSPAEDTPETILSKLEKEREDVLKAVEAMKAERAEMERATTQAIMAGKSVSQPVVQKSNAEILIEKTNALLSGTGLNPFKGRGAGALPQ